MEAINRIAEHLRSRIGQLRELKNAGCKIIGYTPGGYMPEELVHACGAVPVGLIRGGDHGAIAESSAYISRFIDTFCRSQIGYRMLGDEPLYQMIDLLITPVTDANNRAIADCWDFYTDVDVFRFGVPRTKDQTSYEYYLEGLHRLREKLEDFTGNKIDDFKLRESIRLCNKMRELLTKISWSRKDENPRITGREFVALNHASFYADKSTMIEILESLLEELESVQSHLKGPRVLLTGSTLAMGDSKILELLEGAGAAIVFEEFAEGVRHYWEQVDENNDPMKALTDRYFLRRIPPAWGRPSNERLDSLIGLAKDFRVSGVVWYQLLYRESYDMQSFYFQKALTKLNIPMLKITSDYDAAERGAFKTRIEAFIETLGA